VLTRFRTRRVVGSWQRHQRVSRRTETAPQRGRAGPAQSDASNSLWPATTGLARAKSRSDRGLARQRGCVHTSMCRKSRPRPGVPVIARACRRGRVAAASPEVRAVASFLCSRCSCGCGCRLFGLFFGLQFGLLLQRFGVSARRKLRGEGKRVAHTSEQHNVSAA
jgi:hypothetical protein